MWNPARLKSSRILAACALAISCLGASHTAFAAPGGFFESDETTTARPALTATQIAAFMPTSRGPFTFPAPYNTQAVRVTDASDCGGQDCVDMIYSYWRNMSNSTGSNTMYILIGLEKAYGGGGPTLFSYDKTTGQITKVGPLFSGPPYDGYSSESMYFSYSMPTKIYMESGPKLLRYDVLAHTFETVFDSTTYMANTAIHQPNSSNDDDVHSATLENTANNYAVLGCLAYKVSTNHFYYFPINGTFDECQIDKSGRYLEIKETLPNNPDNQCPPACDEDDVVEDLQTGTETVLLDKNGAGGHSDLGYGFMVAADNNNPQPNAWRLWDLSTPLVGGGNTSVAGLSQGGLVYHDLHWGTFEPSHISFENAVLDTTTAITRQYGCGGAVNNVTPATPRENEIQCFLLDPTVPAASEQTLVIAPAMSALNGTAGNNVCHTCLAYAQDPKGNIDPTGQYFFWTSDLDSGRIDAFMVQIPTQLLTSSDVTPPTVSITSPAAGATVSNTITLSANASDDVAVANVQFLLDGNNLGAALTQSPYSMSWDSTTVSAGSHTLSAKATDTSGNTATSAAIAITTTGGTIPNPIGYWKLDEGTGATTADSSGAGDTGTLSSGTSWIPGVSGYALSFDGVSNYVDIPAAAALDAYPLSVAVWMKTSVTTGLTGLVNKYQASSFNGYQVFMDNGNLCAWYFKDSTDYVWDGSGCTFSTAGYADGQWHYVVFTVDGSGGKLYVDGVQKSAQAWTGSPGATSSALDISLARYPGVAQPYFAGSLDDVRIFNAALDSTQVATLYDTSAQPNPIGYWKLDEGTGTTTADSSGAGDTGTLSSGTSWTPGVSGYALSFDGVSNYVDIPTTAQLDAYPLSVAVWMKTSVTTGLTGLVNKYQVSSFNGYQIFMDNGSLCAWYFKDSTDYVWDGSGCTLGTPGYADGQWHKVVFTVDSSGGKLYVDGAQKSAQAWTGSPGATSTALDLSLARYPGVSQPYFSGSLDDVRIFNAALDSAQVATDYNTGVQPVSWTDLVNVTATGNSLQKTSGCDGCADASADSTQQIRASGYFEFTATEINTLRSAGLTNVNAGTGIDNMDFAIRLQSGDAEVREDGVYRASTSFVSGDVFQITVSGSTVTYYKDGVLIYTSSVAPVYPLKADASFSDLNGTITSAMISPQ